MRVLAVLCLVLLAACGRVAWPQGRPAELGPVIAAPDPTVGCDMRVEAPWRGAAGFRVIADAVGVACGDASVSITIAGPRDLTHMASSYQISQIEGVFGSAANARQLTRETMQSALARWIDPGAPERRMAVTSDLPRWPHRVAAPRDTTRVYTPGEGFSRALYQAVRKDRRPLFCYNAESNTLRCLALLADGRVILMAVGRAR